MVDKIFIEVGSGPGLLTRSILEAGASKVIAIEKDRRFFPGLEILQEAVGRDRLELCHGDVLRLLQWSIAY